MFDNTALPPEDILIPPQRPAPVEPGLLDDADVVN